MKCKSTYKFLAALLPTLPLATLHADNLLWSDNFDVPDSGSFDLAGLDGRFSGFLAEQAVARSAAQQHSIVSGMLNLAGGASAAGNGRIRFEQAPGGAPVMSFDFASGDALPYILSGGGIRVEFDAYTTNTTLNAPFATVCIGFPAMNLYAEPTGQRSSNIETDFAVRLRNSGTSQIVKNGALTNTSSHTPTMEKRRVVVDYGFTSLANDSPVTMNVRVNGMQVVLNETHKWTNNSNQLLLEIGEAVSGSRIDNLQIFDKSPLRLEMKLTGEFPFKSDITAGSEIGTLSARLGGVTDNVSYELVAGEGDTDNAKFQISGNSLLTASYSFIGANSTEGQQFSVRVRATSTTGGGATADKVLLLAVTKEDDSDGLPDAWEIAKAGNITSLSGNGIADFDGDGFTDLEEYEISQGTSWLYPTALPALNPALADSDGDGLNDREEVEPGFALPSNARPPTNPTLADTDGDGLNDFVETATGTYVSPTNTGSDPLMVDSDGDGLSDGFEVTYVADGYLPTRDDSLLDTDGDGLTTAQEVSLGTSVVLTDSDGDGLRDDVELAGTAGLRPPTNPAKADTDDDGLSDFEESNTGVYVNGSDTGTNPVKNDTDGDFIRDGIEIAAGSNPFSATSRPAIPASVKIVPLTTDASTGISTAKTYTHMIAPGNSVIINGKSIAPYHNPPPVPVPNFTWASYTPTGEVADRLTMSSNGSWLPADGGVTGTGLKELLRGFAYSNGGAGNGGAGPGSKQTFTLSGLTPGQYYDLRLYQRSWVVDGSGSGRPIDLVFTNGTEVVAPFQGLGADRPDVMLRGGNMHQAYYISFRYFAQSTSMTVDAIVPLGSPANSGSYHFYGLTNEVAVPPNLAITSVQRDLQGNVVIDFVGSPNTTYRVTKSPDLATFFGELTTPMTTVTNASGVGEAIVPASEASEEKEFYRIED
ncbi:hypothetical protein OKA04_21340 [Luteolibacter flavescens]|uniref:Cadherin domain-containing protein n=1 Tax=Luteolibacter flavescens TaxID=1859460 RepID=A0ABT3FUP1_9BACT|nr:hypothetical protein [Luteolibacter flavescens]MCW1887296.1 hypothetical protein [Luteolibacter flavescens]